MNLADVLGPALTALPGDAIAVLLLNPQTQVLEYVVGRGFKAMTAERPHFRLGEGLAGRTALKNGVTHIADLNAQEAGAISIQLLKEGFVSYTGVPLMLRGQVMGVLEIYQRSQTSPEPPMAELLPVLPALAAQMATTLELAGAYNNLLQSSAGLPEAFDAVLESWSRGLDQRVRETEGHGRRVMELAERIGRAFGLGQAELLNLRRGALLHDIGKMGLPDSVLLNPGALSEEEWAQMQLHPQYAFDLLSPIAALRPALDIPYCHHEKWDGSGYPRRLKGEQIPLAARIFTVVDAWDALHSARPYRPAWPDEQVRAYLQSESGKHFDPKVVEVFLKII